MHQPRTLASMLTRVRQHARTGSTRRFRRHAWRALCAWGCALVCLCVGTQAKAQSLAGTYRPSAQRIDVQVVTWGEDCGPRPASQTVEARGTVTVKEEGAHLSLRFADRTLKTNGCWSPNPLVKLVSATSANGRFRAECKTPEGEPKRESGRYTTSAADGTLTLLEESDYDWQLKASHCVAKLRMTQTLTSTSHPAPPATPQPDAAVAAPTSAGPCVPGAPTRLRIKPSEARIGPGERVCFSARTFDAEGCSAERSPNEVSYSLVRPTGVQGSLNGNCFRAAPNTALAEGLFKVVAAHEGLRSEATVTVAAPDLSDITARRGPSRGADLQAQGASEETALESGVRAVASASHGLLWLGLIIAGLAAALSLVAIAALRMARKQLASSPGEGARQIDSIAPSAPPPAPKAAPEVATGPQRICPRCRRGYAPGTARCETDGEPLLDYDVFVKQANVRSAARHCPECGEPLMADAAFCGRCGHKVTPA